MTLSELARRANALQPERLFDEVVEENKEYILDLNTSQLEKGYISIDGERVEPGYASPAYAKFKIAEGSQAPLGVPNLKLEGDFYSGFFLKVEKGGYRIGSTDEKAPALSKKYGTDIFGLNSESKGDLKTVTLPGYLKKLRDELLR